MYCTVYNLILKAAVFAVVVWVNRCTRLRGKWIYSTTLKLNCIQTIIAYCIFSTSVHKYGAIQAYAHTCTKMHIFPLSLLHLKQALT